ncbi:hypothetical protein [Profundibacter amoris]|uniref:Uncharacterized protein n=1 Tax=Profundibacter amoris TaxID=2171755 RepID=A0A347UG53_9RHOB|nr:hypothetical protein [Profundibacter amoris]AXX97831.1 hypothetical protein BAR1_07745 [Profundibacter amoris]
MTEDKTGKMKSEVGVAKKAPPTLTIDWELYGKYLDESNLSDGEKRTFLESLLALVVSAVDLGFGIHPVQQAAGNICEQQLEIAKFIAEQSASVLTSPKNSKKIFNASADRQSGRLQNSAQEGSQE